MPQQSDRPGVIVLGSDFKALGIVRSLGRRAIPCILVDTLPRSAWFSRYITRRFKWNDTFASEKFPLFLQEIQKKYHLDGWILFPTQDDTVESVARNAAQLAVHYRLATPDWNIVRWASDKRLTYRMAQEVDVPYPQTWHPANIAELQQLDIRFPVILKPALSIHLQHALRVKALPANTMDELLKHYRFISTIISPQEILIQEIIPGHGETQYSVGAFCKQGQVLLSMTARRTRQYPIDYGLGSSFVEAVEVPHIRGLAEKLLCVMGITGMVEVEFKYDERDKKYKLLDINVRPWGWHTLCIACGLDLPYIQYCDILDQPQHKLMHVKPRYGIRWRRFITDIPAGIQEIRAGIITPLAYWCSLFGRTTFSVFDWHDPFPVFGDLAVTGSRFLKMAYRRLHLHGRHK